MSGALSRRFQVHARTGRGARRIVTLHDAIQRRRRRVRNPSPKGQRKLVALERAQARAWHRAYRAGGAERPGPISSQIREHALRTAAKRRRRVLGRKRNPKRKAKPMARRRSAAQRAAFRKMIAGLKASKARRRNPRKTRHRKRRRNPTMARARRKHGRRRARGTVMANPRRRRRRFGRSRRSNPRRRRFHARRRNPGRISDSIKMLFGAGIPGLIAGGVAGFIDAKFLSTYSTLVRLSVRVGEAFVAAFGLRSKPRAADAAIGAIVGAIGWEQGYAMGGGTTIGAAPAAKAAGVAALVQEDPRAMGVLVKAMRGMGLTLDNNVSLGAGSALDSGLPQNAYTDVNLG
jgi:hypothetical protein